MVNSAKIRLDGRIYRQFGVIISELVKVWKYKTKWLIGKAISEQNDTYFVIIIVYNNFWYMQLRGTRRSTCFGSGVDQGLY